MPLLLILAIAAIGGAAFGPSVIDGRGWGAPTSFADGHHLLPGPAVDFTKRLAGEVLRLLAPGGS